METNKKILVFKAVLPSPILTLLENEKKLPLSQSNRQRLKIVDNHILKFLLIHITL